MSGIPETEFANLSDEELAATLRHAVRTANVAVTECQRRKIAVEYENVHGSSARWRVKLSKPL